MKAAVYYQYGQADVLKIAEVKKPTPNDNQILIQIKATAVNSGDVRLRKADPFAVRLFFGLTKPKLNILGSVFSGEVVAIGNKVANFNIHDLVFGHTNMQFGAYAEFICVDALGTVALKPHNLTHNQAAAIPFGALTALHFLKKANINPNQRVLIIGASGAVGSAAVQIAKAMGAIVTGVSGTNNLELIKTIGADEVIDYTKNDVTRCGKTFDIIYDTVNTLPVFKGTKLLTANGRLLLGAAGMAQMIQGLFATLFNSKKLISGIISHNQHRLIELKSLAEQNKLVPVMDCTFALHKIAEAHAYVEKGHKKGNVVIEI